MFCERQPQPQRGETVLDQNAVIVLGNECAAPSRRHHADGVATTKLARDSQARLSHRSSIAPNSPDRFVLASTACREQVAQEVGYIGEDSVDAQANKLGEVFAWPFWVDVAVRDVGRGPHGLA